MAGIWAVLPAEHAALVDGTLDAAATAARAAGDPGTLDQLRADGFVDLVVGRLRRPAPESRERPARQAVGDAGWRGNRHGVAGNGHGERPEASRRPGGVAVRVDVTVALSTLMGLDDAPGDLAGYGAITAEQARALAAGGTWRRLVTDPLTGAVLDVGRPATDRPPRSRTRRRAGSDLRSTRVHRPGRARQSSTTPSRSARLPRAPLPATRRHRIDGRTRHDVARQPRSAVRAGPHRQDARRHAPCAGRARGPRVDHRHRPARARGPGQGRRDRPAADRTAAVLTRDCTPHPQHTAQGPRATRLRSRHGR